MMLAMPGVIIEIPASGQELDQGWTVSAYSAEMILSNMMIKCQHENLLQIAASLQFMEHKRAASNHHAIVHLAIAS